MTDITRGVTVNVGVIRGGTKPNVIPEQAYAEVDLRVMTIADADEFVAKILNLKSRSEGVTVTVTGELNRPPYEKGNAGAALYEHAKTLAAEIGFDLVDTFTGGGSDGNFTAPFTATLDGLGVDGEGAHTHYRAIVHLVDRAARAAAASAVPDAAMSSAARDSDDRDAARRWRRGPCAGLVLRTAQGPQAPPPSGRPDREPAAASVARHWQSQVRPTSQRCSIQRRRASVSKSDSAAASI